MPSLLDTSLSGLRAYQGALSTTSNNIANVGNENYTRQRVELNARMPIRQGADFVGQGVDLTSINRIIDDFNTVNIRNITSSTTRLQIFESYANRLEQTIADQDASLMPALDNYFGAVNDVANDPSSNAPRIALLGASENLQQRFQAIGGEMQDLGREIDLRMRGDIAEINSITTELANLNNTITSVSDANNQPSDLLDQRDALLKRLSEKISVTVVEQANGNLNVLIGTGQLLVTNGSALRLIPLQDQAQPENLSVAIQTSGGSVNITQSLVGGELGGLLDFRDNVLNASQNRLGRTAIALSESVNQLQSSGLDLNGVIGVNAFSTVDTGYIQGQFGGAYTSNGFDVGDTVSFDLLYDGRTVNASYTVAAGDSNQDIANGLLFGATGINSDANVTDNLDGTYTLAGTTAGVDLIFELEGTNIGFRSFSGPSPLGNNLQITNLTDGVADDAQMALLPLGSSSTSTTSNLVSTGNPAAFIGPSNIATPNANNGGTGVVDFVVTNASALTISDYEVSFDGTNFNVLRLSDNVTVASGVGSLAADGMQISTGGTAVAGDSFFIRPTEEGATLFNFKLTDAEQFAAAAPIRLSTNINNIGDVRGANLNLIDATNSNLTDVVNIYFDPANPVDTFDVIDVASGSVLQNNVPYFNGSNVIQNGWQLELRGSPKPGDVVSVQGNFGAEMDNSNMLQMAELQTQGVLDFGRSTFEQTYNALTSDVGVVTQQVQINLDVEESLLRSAVAQRESVSGVNLDEEAADLIRFQQAYQALSRVIQTSQELFQSLLAAV